MSIATVAAEQLPGVALSDIHGATSALAVTNGLQASTWTWTGIRVPGQPDLSGGELPNVMASVRLPNLSGQAVQVDVAFLTRPYPSSAAQWRVHTRLRRTIPANGFVDLIDGQDYNIPRNEDVQAVVVRGVTQADQAGLQLAARDYGRDTANVGWSAVTLDSLPDGTQLFDTDHLAIDSNWTAIYPMTVQGGLMRPKGVLGELMDIRRYMPTGLYPGLLVGVLFDPGVEGSALPEAFRPVACPVQESADGARTTFTIVDSDQSNAFSPAAYCEVYSNGLRQFVRAAHETVPAQVYDVDVSESPDWVARTVTFQTPPPAGARIVVVKHFSVTIKQAAAPPSQSM